MYVLDLMLTVAAAVLLVPIVVLAIECFVAAFPWPGKTTVPAGKRPRIAVLVPAHDEEPVIAATLKTVLPQLTEHDRLIVVADNCSDRTAPIAAQAGAMVVERTDTLRRGKGFAMDFGVRYLESNPPDVVVLIDADCDVQPGAIDALARTAFASQRPAQAVNLLDPPISPTHQDRISAFAFRVKNLVRPFGLSRLGLPCFLSTGVAFPWQVIRAVPLASGNIVEDMQLGIDLTIDGHPPLLCRQARVCGRLPQHRSAAVTQRTRWEHGHLLTIRTQVPRLLNQAFRRGRIALVAMALDLCVPPLSFLVLFWSALSAAILTAWFVGGGRIALLTVAGGWILLATALLAAWAAFVRDILPAKTLVAIPHYVLRKVPLYIAFWRKRQGTWVRTSREDAAPRQHANGGPIP